MKVNKITEVQMQIIVNNNLYKKKYIDEVTFNKVNEKLLRCLRTLQLG